MGTVYALIVGINEYEAVNPLRGCVNDATAASEYLKARVAGRLEERLLLDGQATKQAIVDGFRQHLGQAAPGDVAVFWFSGHGGEQYVQPALRLLEAENGLNQTLVCVDSRVNRRPDLVDKELRVLLDDVAARGAHTVAVLDCCHSGGAMRDLAVGVRGVDGVADAPPVEAFIDELVARDGSRDALAGVGDPGTAAHVSLAACGASQLAKELPIDGVTRGIFSTSLLAGLQTLGPDATYRDLLTAARCKVENATVDQVPVLVPGDLDGIADQPFLGGAVTRPAALLVLRNVHGTWEVDAGSAHGIPLPGEGGDVELAVAQGTNPGAGERVRVTAVHPERSIVTPVGWTPNPARVYRVVVTAVPLPPAAVVVGGLDGDDEIALKLVADAVATAAPGGGPSPHIRVVEAGDTSTGLRLRVSTVPEEGEAGPVFRILRSDASPATADVSGHTAKSAEAVVARLEHIAKWTHIKDLVNPVTALADAVSIQVVLAEPNEKSAPPDRAALRPDQNGEIRLSYRRTATGFEPPQIFVRLRNHSDRRLWCVLLNLTDRYRLHNKLFEGGFVGPGLAGVALRGDPIAAKLPKGREVVAGASVRDWFKLIVADEPFSSTGYDLPRLGEGANARSVPRAGGGPRSVLEKLGLRALYRDIGDEDDQPPADWATSILPLVTVVPGEGEE